MTTAISCSCGLRTTGGESEQAAESRIKFSRDGDLDACAKATGNSQAPQVISMRLLTCPSVVGGHPTAEAGETSSRVTATYEWSSGFS